MSIETGRSIGTVSIDTAEAMGIVDSTGGGGTRTTHHAPTAVTATPTIDPMRRENPTRVSSVAKVDSIRSRTRAMCA